MKGENEEWVGTSVGGHRSRRVVAGTLIDSSSFAFSVSFA